MSRWDVCIAEVPFEDLPETKIRPVLILDDTAVIIECLKMTGQPPRAGEYVLKNWKEAGLHKPTVVRISKRLALSRERIRKQIGTLSVVDIAELQKLI